MAPLPLPLVLVPLLVLQASASTVGPSSEKNTTFDFDALTEPFGTKVSDDDPVHKLMPDPTKLEFHLPLKCSACGAVIEHTVRLFRPAIEKYKELAIRDGVTVDVRFREYESVDVYEKLCGEVGRLYGLEVDDKKRPTLRFSRSLGVPRVQGSWMPFFLSSTCEELVDDMEERLTEEVASAATEDARTDKSKVLTFYPDKEIVEKVRQSICTSWDRSSQGCDWKGLPIDPRSDGDIDDHDDRGSL
ncbi:hypothetical protein ERJ75_001526900 [Trypanosoma vivax]|uniref:DUF3456 domain-containing protein n=1 Tax=Trypanosoma vivax (strain Y486) TaxID=1055687 RepID=G0UB65_TRYVY|nr:hypothetical protein TRVL_02861 [Trypanosoma vivax]KAH8606236.1 hypothetical protein ERJ75_001526900 [Trypanosoma vivax]CCC53052.1 conserved hypothetical protein [Trypanosoma vivax Y486]